MEELLNAIKEIRSQQEKLVFTEFNEETAWKIGNMLREKALEKEYAIAIHISLCRRRLFACTMEGTTPINDQWIRRKENTVYQFYKSSYEMSLYMKLKEDDIAGRYGLEAEDYAAAGGSVPIILKGSGVVGAITVSGLAENEDHGLIVDVISQYLNT